MQRHNGHGNGGGCSVDTHQLIIEKTSNNPQVHALSLFEACIFGIYNSTKAFNDISQSFFLPVMDAPFYFVAPKPQLARSVSLAQHLHDMVVSEELNTTIPMLTAPAHWMQNSASNAPFNIWEPVPPPHNFYSKYSPLADYGYVRIHTASLFSPQDEILDSSRGRFATQPIGSRTPKPIVAPSTIIDHRPADLTSSAPRNKVRRADRLPSFLNEKVLWKLRSLKRGSQRLYIPSYGSTLHRTRILCQ